MMRATGERAGKIGAHGLLPKGTFGGVGCWAPSVTAATRAAQDDVRVTRAWSTDIVIPPFESEIRSRAASCSDLERISSHFVTYVSEQHHRLAKVR